MEIYLTAYKKFLVARYTHKIISMNMEFGIAFNAKNNYKHRYCRKFENTISLRVKK